MKLNTTLKFTLLAGLAAAATPASANIAIYGKANVTIQSSDLGTGSYSELKSNASRLGFKGDLALENGLTAVFKYEFQVDLADEADANNLKSRNQYVGIKSRFGELLLGRNDTMFKQAQGKTDLFNDYEGDLKRLWKGENRLGDSITYTTASFNQFRFGVTYLLADAADGKDGISAAITYGDQSLNNSGFYTSIALDSDVKGYDAMRVLGHFKLAELKISLGWQNQQALTSGEQQQGYLLNTSYTWQKTTFKTQFQTLEDSHVLSAGLDYKLSAKTKLFGWYTKHNKETSNDNKYLAIGLEYSF